MNAPGVQPGTRVLVVGQDVDVAVALHQGIERAGWALHVVPTPELLEPLLRIVAPHLVVLMLPASPGASWGSALTAAATAARVGVRVVVIAPSREVVEPLAAVAGAERALSRAEVLARPLSVVERLQVPGAAVAPAWPSEPAPAMPAPAPGAFPPVRPSPYAAPPPAPAHAHATAGPFPAPASAPAFAGASPFGSAPAVPAPPFAASAAFAPAPPAPTPVPRAPTADHAAAERSNVDLMALIDEELVDEPRNRPQVTRIEVNVSLVSEHNFYVGATRRLDSGGVFVSTALPPRVGTRLQVRLGLADGRKLDLEGEVVFIREKSALSGRQPAGCGIKLFGIPGWATDAIDRFLMARPPIIYV